jgi:hypothetical protein
MTRKRALDSKKLTGPETQRRTLLRVGLALPIGSAAMLAACGGGGSGGGGGMPFGPMAIAPPPESPPVPPPEPVPDPPPPPLEEVPVPPVEPPPAKPVQEAVKNVRVLNLQTGTFTPPANQRLAGEDIKTYTERAMKDKFDLLSDALTQGLPKKTAETDLCYFVVPEFFWNVNWDAVNDEDELKVFSETCVVEVQKHARALIALFPQDQFGKLALLPGTAQVVTKQIGGVLPAPAPYATLPAYEALNYVLVIDNFSLSNPDGSRPIAMWPKRNVSGIDFTTGWTLTTKDGRDYWVASLGKFDILVQQQSTTAAAYFANGNTFKGFDNDPLGGVPFGVDVCLDYASAYTDSEYLRMSQIENTNYIIDFLIACGMGVDPTHKYLPSVQYIVRNDGMTNSSGTLNGTCEILKLAAPDKGIKTGIATRPSYLPVPQVEVAQLKNNSILFDAYIEVHPLWDYPSMTIPTNPLPSPFAPPPP